MKRLLTLEELRDGINSNLLYALRSIPNNSHNRAYLTKLYDVSTKIDKIVTEEAKA